MPFRICKAITVESGHLLTKHPAKCRFPHGHSRRIEIVLAANALDANEMVCDFKHLKTLVEDFVEQFDHAMCLNTADPHYEFYRRTYERVVPFENHDPTSELMARRVFEHVRSQLDASPDALGRRVRIERVRVHETGTSWAEYEA
jgi:6-pyruvoyltetrahydropterin/6-carboxytetrahydropterin synthase